MKTLIIFFILLLIITFIPYWIGKFLIKINVLEENYPKIIIYLLGLLMFLGLTLILGGIYAISLKLSLAF